MKKENNILGLMDYITKGLNSCEHNCNALKRLYNSGDFEDALEKSYEVIAELEALALFARKGPLYLGDCEACGKIANVVTSAGDVRVMLTKEGWLKVVLPLIPPKKNKGSTEFLRLMMYPPLQDFFNDKEPVTFEDAVIVFCHIYDPETIVKRRCDHDNFELNFITDALALFALPDDGPDTCMNFHCSLKGDCNCTEVFVVPQEDFMDFYKKKILKRS